MTNLAQPTTLIPLFWHRTRSCAVPLTADEIAARTGLSRDAVMHDLRAGVRAGILQAQRQTCGARGTMIYELTPTGLDNLREVQA